MTVLAGLDIATTTGITILDGEQIVMCNAFRWEGRCSGEIFRHFRKTLYRLIETHKIEHVAAEEPLRTDIEIGNKIGEGGEIEKTRPPMKTFQRIYGLCAVAEEVCAAHGVPFRYVHQATWRKSFTGNGRATKDESLATARLIQKSIVSHDAAESLGVAWYLRGNLDQRFSAPRGDLFEPKLAPAQKRTPF